MAFPTSIYNNFSALELKPDNTSYYLYNNLWNLGRAKSASQSLIAAGPKSFSTIWDIDSLGDWDVISYSAAINGWHFGWRYPQVSTRLFDRKPVKAKAEFALTNDPVRPSRFDVAFDIWFHDNPAGNGNRVHETMIWVAYSRDLGFHEVVVDTPTIGGVQWKVWNYAAGTKLPHSMTNFVVNGADLNGFDFNLTDFTDYMVLNLGKPPGWWMTGIEFGPEIYKGRGILDVKSYDLTR